MRYEAILFDFDGVLVDSERVHCECWQEILTPYGVQLDWKTYCEHGLGISDRDLLAHLCRKSDRSADLVERLMTEYPRKTELFRSRMLERQPFSTAVLELLAELRSYTLAVVTSSGRYEVEPILIQAGVHDFFRTIVYGSDVSRLKPAPDPYLLALERLGVSTGLAIEDTDAGEASARASGLDVLRIHTQCEMPTLLRDKLARSAGTAGLLG